MSAEREAFEAWYAVHSNATIENQRTPGEIGSMRRGDEYDGNYTTGCWHGWRAATSAHSAREQSLRDALRQTAQSLNDGGGMSKEREALHAQIMNVPPTKGIFDTLTTEAERGAYMVGHRDARHAAAELGAAATSAHSATLAAVTAERDALRADAERMKRAYKMLADVVQDMTVANQSAWIEWQHGKGAEAAMVWIHNGLAGPGFIPDESAPYGKEAQAWYDANNANPLPQCHCGRPSNIGWMEQGFCSDAHYRAAKAAHDAAKEQQ
jgi:hypothetical protein